MTARKNFYKSKYFHVMACVVLAIVAALVLLPFGVSEKQSGHDLRYHFNVIRALSVAWEQGSFFSKIMECIGGDYGYGTGLFYSAIPAGLCVLLMKTLHLPIMGALYAEFLLLFASSAITVYFFLRRAFKSNALAMIGGALYLLYPYFLWDLYVRFAFTEIFLMLAMPLIVWGVYELLYRQNPRAFLPLFIAGYTVAIFSHLTMSVYITIFLAIWLLIDCKRTFKGKNLLYFAIAAGIVLLITASYYLPMLVNYGVTETSGMSKTPEQMETNTKKYFTEYILMLDYAFVVGIGFLYALWYAFLAKKKRTAGKTALLVSSVLIAFTFTHFFPWQYMPNFLRMIQYTFRVLLLGGVISVVQICVLIKEVLLTLPEKKEDEIIFRIPKKPSGKEFWKLFSAAFLCVGFLSYGTVAALHDKNMFSAYDNASTSAQVAMDDLTGRSEFYGLGAGKHGDYFPKNCQWSYVSKRLKDELIYKTNMTVSEVGNYDGLSQVSFIVQKTQDGYAILNIPYEAFAGVEVYRFRTTSSNKQLEINAESYDDGRKVRLTTADDGNESKIILSYKNAPVFKAYLQAQAFGVLTLDGDAAATNLKKVRAGEYSLDVSVGEGGVLELPSYYYKGYKLTLTKADGTRKTLEAAHGRNGFVEVEVTENGTLSVEFSDGYLTVSNVLSGIGATLFVGVAVWACFGKKKESLE